MGLKEDLDWDDPDTPGPAFGLPQEDERRPGWREAMEAAAKKFAASLEAANAKRGPDEQWLAF